MVRTTLRVFGSNLAVNLSSFVVLALAGRTMPVDEFAKLNLIVAAGQLGSSALDFGGNVGVVKKYSENRESRFLSALIWLKSSISGFCLALILIGYLANVEPYWLVAIACAASIDLWSGARALDQAQLDFSGFSQANVLFAILRLPLAIIGLALASASAIAAALYIVPFLAVAIYRWRDAAAKTGEFDPRTLAEVFRYALPAYISATLYTVAIYYPQYVISQRLDASAIATFGVLLIFRGPLVLLSNSVRTHLLPLVASNAIRRSDILGNLKVIACWAGGLAAALVALAVGAVLIEQFYGARYPGIGLPFGIFLGLNILSLFIGPFNLEVHRLGRIEVEAIVNAARLFVLAVMLGLFGNDLLSIVIISGLVILAGECVLFLTIGELSRRDAVRQAASVIHERNLRSSP